MMGGMPPMGSMIGGGMQMPSLGMDDMMSKMMGNMNMGGLNMGSSMQSSSFSSSSSSSSNTSMMSSDFGGMGMPSLGMGMPPMRGMEMPGFPSMPGMSIEEMAPMPPPTPSQTAEATVLLKVKDGDEYKLALNMQQYSPDDITIKLNGNELVVEAAGHGEHFRQKHVVPDNINLDLMSSSFSSDGVLVIKAPKK